MKNLINKLSQKIYELIGSPEEPYFLNGYGEKRPFSSKKLYLFPSPVYDMNNKYEWLYWYFSWKDKNKFNIKFSEKFSIIFTIARHLYCITMLYMIFYISFWIQLIFVNKEFDSAFQLSLVFCFMMLFTQIFDELQNRAKKYKLVVYEYILIIGIWLNVICLYIFAFVM